MLDDLFSACFHVLQQHRLYKQFEKASPNTLHCRRALLLLHVVHSEKCTRMFKAAFRAHTVFKLSHKRLGVGAKHVHESRCCFFWDIHELNCLQTMICLFTQTTSRSLISCKDMSTSASLRFQQRRRRSKEVFPPQKELRCAPPNQCCEDRLAFVHAPCFINISMVCCLYLSKDVDCLRGLSVLVCTHNVI